MRRVARGVEMKLMRVMGDRAVFCPLGVIQVSMRDLVIRNQIAELATAPWHR